MTFSTQDNAKLLEQLKSGFKRTIKRNKYEPKVTIEQQSRYFDFLINLCFQGVNRLFVFNGGRKSYMRYYPPLVELKNSNVVIDERNFFDQPLKNNLIIYDNIRKIAIGRGDHCTTGCLLDYNYFNNYYKIIAIDLSERQALDADPEAQYNKATLLQI